MMLIFGLMLLLQTAACLDRSCSFGQSGPCYAALGDKLNLLMVDAREYDLQIKRRINDNTEDGPVCRVKNDTMKSECDLYKNRPEVTVINGTVIIKRVIRSDSGNYRLTLYNSDGTVTSRDLQVIVEAPIGSVEVSIICSSNQRSVFCSSDGDHIIYSWTLNGEILEQGPMNGNTTIQLKEETDGDISCSMKNHVSHAQKTITLKPCPGPTTAAVTPTPESGLDNVCWFGQSDPCYAALGDKLNLLMEQDAREYDLILKKRINNNTADDPVCRIKNGRMRMYECDLYNNRPEVTVINGTVIIKRVIRSDSGNYRLTLVHSNGTVTSRDLQVIVEGTETLSSDSFQSHVLQRSHSHADESVESLGSVFSVCGVCSGLVSPADGSVRSVRSFSHLHETHVRKERGR